MIGFWPEASWGLNDYSITAELINQQYDWLKEFYNNYYKD